MSHRSVWAWVAVVGALTLGSAGKPASASVLRFEMLPESARTVEAWPAWGRTTNALGQSIESEYGYVPSFGRDLGRAYLVSDGERRDLGDLGGDYVSAFAINDRSQVVGTATDTMDSSHNPHWRPFLWEDGVMINLAPDRPDWNLVAMEINNSGQVVGGNQFGMWDGEAFLYENGEFRSFGTLGGRSSVARAINESGLIVGSSRTAPTPNPWHSGGFEEVEHAILIDDGVMYDLNDLTVNLGDRLLHHAYDVTEDGWILASVSVGPEDRELAWLSPVDLDDLDPIEPDPNAPDPDPIDPGTGGDPGPVPIPEPASVALWFGLATSAVVWQRKHRKTARRDELS